MTTSPRPTPFATSVEARREERSAASPKEISRLPPARSRATRARRSAGAASTRSLEKFICNGSYEQGERAVWRELKVLIRADEATMHPALLARVPTTPNPAQAGAGDPLLGRASL